MINQNPQAKLNQQVQSNTQGANNRANQKEHIGKPSIASPKASKVGAPNVDAGEADKKGFKAWLLSKMQPTPKTNAKPAPGTGAEPSRGQPDTGSVQGNPKTQTPKPNPPTPKVPKTGGMQTPKAPKPKLPKFRR